MHESIGLNSVSAAPAAQPPIHRCGTFTFGAALVLAGLCMLASAFFPQLDMTLALKLSPLALVSLGVETLLAARGGGQVRYDWVGMLLSTVIVCTALVLFGIAWYITKGLEWYCPW